MQMSDSEILANGSNDISELIDVYIFFILY